MSEETKRKISVNHRRYQSKETIEKIRKTSKGRKKSEEFREKLRNRLIPKETREKLRKANIGKRHTKETKEKIRN
jgi:hypothetical protein